jgi:hypothetical protein
LDENLIKKKKKERKKKIHIIFLQFPTELGVYTAQREGGDGYIFVRGCQLQSPRHATAVDFHWTGVKDLSKRLDSS